MAAGSGIAALGSLASLAIYRPYFIGVAGLALVYSFLAAFWQKRRAGALRPTRYWIGSEEVVLAATTLVVFLLIFLPYLRGVQPGDVRVYDGSGTVIQVDKEENKLTLQHWDVEDILPAMTMDYEVESASLLDGLKPGDQVRFKLRPRGFDFMVVEIGLLKRR